MKIPDIHLSANDLQEAEELELLSLTLETVIPNSSKGSLVILSADEKAIALPLSSHEGTMLAFAHEGLASSAHIKTLPQMYIQLLDDIGAKIEAVALESKVGDVIYASIKLTDRKNRRFWALCSPGDGIVLSVLAQCPLYAVRAVWDELPPIDEWATEDVTLHYDGLTPEDDDEYYDDEDGGDEVS